MGTDSIDAEEFGVYDAEDHYEFEGWASIIKSITKSLTVIYGRKLIVLVAVLSLAAFFLTEGLLSTMSGVVWGGSILYLLFR